MELEQRLATEKSELLGRFAVAFPKGARLRDSEEALLERARYAANTGAQRLQSAVTVALYAKKILGKDTFLSVILERCKVNPEVKLAQEFFKYYLEKGYSLLGTDPAGVVKDGAVRSLAVDYRQDIGYCNISVQAF